MSQSFATLMRRLKKAGFEKDFVREAILPDWWAEDCAHDPTLVPDLEFRVARFLDEPVAVLRDPQKVLASPAYPDAQLRRVRDISRDRLAPAIHAAIQIAGAVVRNLRPDVVAPVPLPEDGLTWRQQIKTLRAPKLKDVAGDLWQRGIAVVPLECLPRPSFQGIACIVDERPVLLFAHRHDEPGRAAFLLAHEAGHVANGDCSPGSPVVDEEDEVDDDDQTEQRADRYASRLLIGENQIPQLKEVGARDFKSLARRASAVERETGADATAVIFAWARLTNDYATATMALRALYSAIGARKLLRQQFDTYVDVTTASDTDRALLRCVYQATPTDEVAR